MSARDRRVAIVLGAVVGGFLALNVLFVVVDRYTRDPSGPRSSSYATAPEGLAAYAGILARAGHGVTQLRERPHEARLDPRATLVLLDPDAVPPADSRALRAFVERGGRLVAGGAGRSLWLSELLGSPPSWAPDGVERATVLAPAAEVEGVGAVRAAGEGSWDEAGETLPILGRRGAVVAGVAGLGRGRIVLLADPSPLQNRHLAEDDNAAFGLLLAGVSGRPVVFVESVHGYGRSSGYGAVPGRWWWAFGGLVLAALTLMVARGRRLGPPERESREFPPARREYVDSLGVLLARVRRPAAAIAPVQAAVRERLERRAGLEAGAPVEALVLAAKAGGLGERDVAGALAERPDVLAAGRVLARLEREAAGIARGGRP